MSFFSIINDICIVYTFGSLVWMMLPKQVKFLITNFCKNIFHKKIEKSEYCKFGNVTFTGICLLDGINLDYEFDFKVDKKNAQLPDELKEVAKLLEQENEERKNNGLSPVFSDLKPYAVHSIVFKREDQRGETNHCLITLRPSSYFYSLISISKLDYVLSDGQTIREKYFAPLSQYHDKPCVNGFDVVSALGINTMVVTSDDHFVFGLRNEDTVSTGASCLHVSVGEHLNQDLLDHNPYDDKTDSRLIVLRGIYQELGVESEVCNVNDVHFLGIALSERHYQYGTFSVTVLPECSDNYIRTRWQNGMAKDGLYENRDLIFINAKISDIVNYLNEHKNMYMTQWAMLSACMALLELKMSSRTEIHKWLSKLRPDALK